MAITGVELESLESKMQAYQNQRKSKKLIQAPAPYLNRTQIQTYLKSKKQEKMYNQQATLYGFDMIDIAKKSFNDKIEREYRELKNMNDSRRNS